MCSRQKVQFVQKDRNDVCLVVGLQYGWNVRFRGKEARDVAGR